MVNPNKYIRKALFDAINPTYPCFDTNVTGKLNQTQYVIISTQDKVDTIPNKCNHRWEVSTLLDIVFIYNGAGNVGSRVANDDMESTILGLISDIEIDGFTVLNREYEFPSNLDSSSSTQTVFRINFRMI
jgi:hypothetical protein